MKKRIFAILLVLAMVLSFSACGIVEDTTGDENVSFEEKNDTVTKGTEETAGKQEETKPVETTEAEVSDAIDPEFKKAMDAYVEFYEDYVSFMKKYQKNPTDLSLLTEYTTMMADAAEMEQKFADWDQDEMNAAELQYYLDVSAKVLKLLAEVAQ